MVLFYWHRVDPEERQSKREREETTGGGEVKQVKSKISPLKVFLENVWRCTRSVSVWRSSGNGMSAECYRALTGAQ